MSVAPRAKLTEFLNFRVGVIGIVLHGQTFRVKDADVTTKTEEDA